MSFLKILTVNVGSSSVRLGLFVCGKESPQCLAAKHYETEIKDPQVAVSEFLQGGGGVEVDAVAHRIVHGGEQFCTPVVIDSAVESKIDQLSNLAPLHNPEALRWVRACRKQFGDSKPQIAVFDTSFYRGLPAAAKTYAVPRELSQQYGLQRFGFHGIAHKALWDRWVELRPEKAKSGRVVSVQLGSGCSMTAMVGGRAVDTSMGFSPTEGLVMATRCGDLDAGLLLYLQEQLAVSPSEIKKLLNQQSGLLGVSGESGDMRVLLQSSRAEAKLAIELYCYRVVKYLGAFFAVMQGADAVLFGGGVGVNSPTIREKILSSFNWCGLRLDREKNQAAINQEACVSHPNSEIEVWAIPVDEGQSLALAAAKIVCASRRDC